MNAENIQKVVSLETALLCRDQLHEAIKLAIIKFQEETGLLVDSIRINRFEGSTTKTSDEIAKMFSVVAMVGLRRRFML